MMDSGKGLMLISAIALYKAIRFISDSLHASYHVPVDSNNVVAPNSMASSSDITDTPPATKYDVFLSFRGEDTRDNFTSHLYEALCNTNIKTYIDYKLHKGEQISPTLLRTIGESEISVIIFSKDYASSTWCLDELVKIMECKDKYGRGVIPVFYNVDPSNVRKQSGSFGNAFAKLKRRFKNNKDKVQMWRDALTRATALCGWDSKNIRPESELIKRIVKDILRKLDCISSCYFEGLVGIHHHIEKMEELLSEVRIVGIWGMGGIGKTTLAKAVFHKLKVQYESVSFVENVREQLVRIGLDQLQEKCLKELLKDEDIDTYNIRSTFVKNRLQRKKILLVLDDVDNSIQVEDLTKLCDWFGQESKIIITSRDIQVLKNATAFRTYHIPNMNFLDALHLFSLKAFKQNGPTDSYVELSKWIVEYCQGNPLALVVMGCFLYGRRKEEWESALEKLKQAPYKDIINVLRLSFDGLDDNQKNIFLDLACVGTERLSMDFVRDYYDSTIYIEISVLKDRSLVSIDEKFGIIGMHDLVRKMGQEISRQQLITDPRKPIRLWNHDDVYHFFNDYQVSQTIQYISLDMCKIEGILLKASVFKEMHHLKFLKFYKSAEEPSNVYLFEGLDSLPEKLRIFWWEEYPLSYVPLSFCAKNLVELDMPNSHLQYLWDGDQHFPKLKEINLTESKHLIRLPDLSQAPNIEKIYVGGCVNLTQIHSSSVLPKLEDLWMHFCEKLRRINIGSTINGRSSGLVAIYNFFDLINFSFNKVTIKVFISDDEHVSGFRFKVVSIPLTEISECMNSIEKEEIKFLGQSLTSLLPFVGKVRWLDITEFGSCMEYFETDLESDNRVGRYKVNGLELRGKGTKEVGMALEQAGRALEVEEKLMIEVECSSNSNNSGSNRLTRVPNNISRWSLLTQLTLQKRDIIGSGACSGIPGLSTLKSLSETNCTSLQPIMDLTVSLDTTELWHASDCQIYHYLEPTESYLSYIGFSIYHLHYNEISIHFWDS